MSEERRPSITIGIEAWNAGDLKTRWLFEACFNSLKAQTFPLQDCELILVIDAKTTSEDEGWLTGMLPATRVLRLPKMTYFRAKNAIMRAASGEYILFADSDMTYEAKWLKTLVSCLEDGKDLVVGKTVYSRGFLHRTLNFCDWGATQIRSGPAPWFYGNNVAMRKRLADQITFREDFGQSGGAAVNAIRQELWSKNVTFWYSAEASGVHYLPPFLYKRLRIGAYHVRLRMLSDKVEYPWLIRIPFAAPFLITAGTMVRAWQRAWKLKSTLPGNVFALPFYFGTIAFVKFVEVIGAYAYRWAPLWLNRRYNWFVVAGSESKS